MNILNSNEWIAHFLATDPPRSKSLVMTIFGDSIVPRGGTVWLGSLIELLAPFGINDRLVRTSVFRLAQEGWLASQRDGRRSSYSVPSEAIARFTRAYRRIYAPLHRDWDGQWTLVMHGNNGLTASERSNLRKELLWQGYAILAPGLAAHPAGDREILDELLARTGTQQKLYVCQTADLPGVRHAKPLREMVADGWDLSGVMAGYEQFIALFEPLLALLKAGPAPAPEQAFVIRTLLMHAYRRVQLHDPQLPVDLLPEPWPGANAYELARALYLHVYEAAESHITAALRREDPEAREADASLVQRFGGLK